MTAPLSWKSSFDMSTMSNEPLFFSSISSSFEFEPVLFLVEEITVDSDLVSCCLSYGCPDSLTAEEIWL